MTSRPRSLLSETKLRLREAGLQAKKSLGQHFLVDGSYLKHIFQAADLDESDNVVEVGPGLGVMTEGLAARSSKVVAIEKDDHLAALLQERFKSRHEITVVNQDILKVDVCNLCDEYFGNRSSKYKVVANLPYYVVSPVLRLFLESDCKPESLVVMVQREVARQITAKPGEMSLLSIGVQLYGKARIVKNVPARAFYPPPEVESAILEIIVFSKPAVDVETSSFFHLVRAGFSAARKQIINPLSHGLDLPKDRIAVMLGEAGIEPRRRAETLSIEEWGRLWEVFVKNGYLQ